ncbi:Undecaprenyl phosphate-alpha-4-amino-4-deoxy-L-arabinose arabinosyl transferase [Anaerohalosphaera lusitana]|uniref:Undecaprenyl phosphate-alpha-4-amino-4-deoxy-L-arabinose arabinosyl transferase n=1 Tax=Anaerohalosphaera lusitana TaxID=1936003 RepID=A0A1U9NGH6_9BACT|nr:glycosyltransferase family 39 protein [Anaerohalosphaera lusitana]AQT67043.1 Undecaprenyl phosphate-alpha-4-amino-4-deoxy-L-arabinose arabinosyl transferase [Anaerohalosphaera lusitana]
MANAPKEIAVEQHKIPATVFILAVGLITAGWMLGPRPVSDDEARISVTAREMLASGDYIVPTFNTEPQLAPSPLPYWLTALAAQFTGRVDAFTARLPSFILAILSTASILYFAQRILPFRTACLSALIWATSFGFVSFARNAVPAMTLTALTATALLAFYAGLHEEHARRRVTYMLTFYITFALAALTNLLLAVPAVLIPLIAWFTVTRSWRLCKHTMPIVGTLVFLAVLLPWPMLAARQVGSDTLFAVWKSSMIEQFFSPGLHPAWFSVLMVFEYAAPFIAFVPLAVIAPFYKVWAETRTPMKFLWCWFVSLTVLFTILPARDLSDILPAIPPLAILAGIIFEDLVYTRKAHTRRFIGKFFQYHVIIILFGSIIAAALVARYKPDILFEACAVAVAAMVLTALLTLLFMKGKRFAACITLFAGLAVITILTVSLILIPITPDTQSGLAARASRRIPASADVYAYGSVEPAFLHYFGRSADVCRSVDEVQQAYEDGAFIIAFAQAGNELAKSEEFNQAATLGTDDPTAGSVTDLRIFRKPD